MSKPAPERVLLGLVTRSRGLRGEMMLDRAVEGPYPNGLPVQIGSSEYVLERLQAHQGRSLIKVSGIGTVELADAQRDREVTVARGDVLTGPGEYLLQDLLGCDVVDDAAANVYGIVSGWQSNGAQILLEVDSGDAEPVLVPLVPAICLAVLPNERLIRVKLPDGLVDLNKPSARA